MHTNLIFARGDFIDIATVVIVVVVGVIRFLYGIMKKPNVPPGGQQPAAPKTPEALQQEIEKFIRQAQGRDPKPLPPKPVVIEQRPPEPLRQRLPAEERRESKPREQNRPKPKKAVRSELRPPEPPAMPLSKRHAIEAEVQQSLGENRPQRRSEKPDVPSIEQHMHSVFSHKLGALDTEVEDRSFSSITTTAGKAATRLRMTKEQIRQAVIFNEILARPNFDDD